MTATKYEPRTSILGHRLYRVCDDPLCDRAITFLWDAFTAANFPPRSYHPECFDSGAEFRHRRRRSGVDHDGDPR